MAQSKNASVTVVGALAYDQISSTRGQFTGRSDPLLNYKLDDLAEVFGGCGGNIAYNLASLGTTVQLVSATGAQDDQRYLEWLARLNIDCANCMRVDGAYSPRAVIITDADGHQFTGFFPGPNISADSWSRHLQHLDFTGSKIFLQAPYPPTLMQASLNHVQSLAHKPLRVCCPGQYADQLKPGEVVELVQSCDWLVGNAYELEHLSRHASLGHLLIIATNGAKPIQISHPNTGNQPNAQSFSIPTAPRQIDPTGCGDAFLSGLVHDLSQQAGIDYVTALPAAVECGIQTAGRCIGYTGGQQHFNETRAL